MQLFKNTLWLTLSFTISRGISIFWNIYLARTFSASLNDLGVYMYIMAQFALFSILAEGNISYTFQHFISKELLSKEESVSQYWTFSFYAKFVLGIVFGLALYFIIVNQYPDYQFTAFLVSITLLVFNIGAAPLGIFIAHNDFKVQIVSYLINSLFFASFSIFAIMFTKNINIIIGILLFSNVIASVYSVSAGVKLYGIPKKRNDIFNLTKKILKFSAPLLLASFCFSFYYRMDINIIAGKMTANYVSYISIALMFFFLIVDFLWSQLASAMTPDLIRRWTDKKSDRQSVIDQLVTLLILYTFLTCLIVVGIKLFGKITFNLILGSKGGYENIIPILNYLLVGLPFLVAYAFLYRIYLVNNKSLNFMLSSVLFLTLKFIIYSSVFNYFSYQNLTIISSVLLVLVYIVFVFTMKELREFRYKLLQTLTKLIIVFFSLILYILYLPEDNFGYMSFISSAIFLTTVFASFNKTINHQIGKIKLFNYLITKK